MHPWGDIRWILGLSRPRRWQFVGCLGTEQRSLAAYFNLADLGILDQQTLLKIEESHSPYTDLANRRFVERTNEYRAKALQPNVIARQLLDPIKLIEPLGSAPLPESMILDITSMPKRYFFFLLKRYLLSDEIKDLVVTYSLPAQYASTALSENVEPWDVLPTFRQPNPDLERIANRRLIVNIGFMPEGLAAHVEGPDAEKHIDLLIPFPSPVASSARAWHSVWTLTPNLEPARINEHRVGANDMSEAFMRILSLRPHDSKLVSFAPFGPKPISAAMCLYAALSGSPVYYAQPKVYNPDYSTGVSIIDRKPEIYGYWVKHDGKSLYGV